MIYVRSSPPDELPIAVSRFKAHLRREADDTFEDELLEAYLQAAVDHLDGRDGILGRCLVSQEWTAYADAPDPRRGFRLELGPVRNDLLVSVRYWSAGSLLFVDPSVYRVEQEVGEQASVVLAPGRAWPLADAVRNAWQVTFTAGYGTDEHVPPAIRAAILLLAADLYGDRSGKMSANQVANPTVDRLLTPYRTVTV